MHIRTGVASRLPKRVGLLNKNTNTKEENKVTAFTHIRTPIPASYTSFRIIRSSSLCRGRLTDTRTRDTRLHGRRSDRYADTAPTIEFYDPDGCCYSLKLPTLTLVGAVLRGVKPDTKIGRTVRL